MSLTTSEMTPADISAITNGGNGGFGGEWSWIIVLFLFCIFGGFRGNGMFGGSSGAMDNYVLASDFATIQRQISDSTNSTERKLDSITNGLCDLGYTQAQLINGIGSQLASCCCDIREGISGVNYNMAMNSNAIQNAISSGFCQTNYNMATQSAQTMQAIDKVGDRVIDYLANKENQNLRDENFALRLSASQQAQNNYLVSQLGQKCPEPAYLVCNPNGPLNYSVNTGCGCGSF